MRILRVDLPLWFRWRPLLVTANLLLVFWLCLFEYPVAWVGFLAGHMAAWYFYIYVEAFHIGAIEMDDQFIRKTTILGRYEMAWDEVIGIEMPRKLSLPIRLEGTNKRLTIANERLWTGEDKTAMIELFHRQIAERQIYVSHIGITRWKDSKNTKVSRAS